MHRFDNCVVCLSRKLGWHWLGCAASEKSRIPPGGTFLVDKAVHFMHIQYFILKPLISVNDGHVTSGQQALA